MAERVGPYELIRPIGSGGMGQVHLARSVGPEGFEKLLVLKTLRPDHAVDSRFVTMFLDEARLAARLIHPHVVHIFDLGEAAGTYYIAMEYVPGVDVASLTTELGRKGQSLPLALACRIVIDAASGLHYAHELKGPDGHAVGLVHRDVSPQNILVGYEGAVKVIDFGIAKAAGRLTQTRTGALKGKFAYMSPEQAHGDALDRRSDVFALGVVFHELITGSRLFDRDSDTEVLRAVQDCTIELPSKLKPDLPPALDTIVARALAKNRDDRYSTAHDMLAAIESFSVENRLPATQAQLSSFLQGIYPENVVRESTPSGIPDTVVPGRKSSAATGFAPTTVSSASRRRSAALWVGGIGAATAISVFATLSVTRHGAQAQPVSIPAPVPAPSAKKVKLRVDSTPRPADVLLDGLLVGSTPFEKEVDPVSKANLELRAVGMEPWKNEISLEDDLTVSPQLELARVSLHIESEPAGATVRAAGKQIGQTPTDQHFLPHQPIVLTFSLSGYQDLSKKVTPGDEAKVVVQLKKVAGPKNTGPDLPFEKVR